MLNNLWQRPPGYRSMLVTFTGAVAMDACLLAAVNVALPNMMGTFSRSFDEISWVTTVYLIAATVFVPLSSWFSRVMGARSYFLSATTLFLLSSLGCAVSPSFSLLLFFRAIQGAAGSSFRARAMLAITTDLPAEWTLEALVVFVGGLGLATSVGWWLGGWLSEAATWRLVFLLPVVPGLFALGFLLLGLEPRGKTETVEPDWLGFVLLLVGIGSFQTVLSRGEREDWFYSPLIVGLSLLALLSLLVFGWREGRPGCRHPLLNLSLLRERNMAAGMLLALLLGLFMTGGLYIMPQFLRTVAGYDGIEAGRLMTVDALGMCCSMLLATLALRRISGPILLGTGCLLFCLSMAHLTWYWTSYIPREALWLPLFLRGASLGFFIIPLGKMAMISLEKEQIGDARALYYFFRQLGGSLGVSLITLLVDWRETFHSSHLGQALKGGSPGLSGSVQKAAAGLQSHGYAPDRLPLASLAVIRQKLLRETQTLAYQDIFFSLFLFGLLAGFLVLLLHGPLPKRYRLPRS